LTALTVVGLVGAVSYLPASGGPGAFEFVDGAAVLSEPIRLPEFSLVDHGGAPFGRKQLEGRWSLLFFGYTRCPDVCPLTLHELRGAMETWRQASDVEIPQVVFISVDPERDTTERLHEYVEFFDPTFIGVSGEAAEVATLAKAVGAFYGLRGDASSPAVDHSSRLFLVNPAADLVVVLEDPRGPELLIRLLPGIRADRLGVEDAWVPLPPPASNAVAYLELHNRTDRVRTLLGASSPDCSKVEIHRSVVEHGRVRMESAGPLEIRPGEALVFGPRGLHLMLIEPRSLEERARVTLHLELDRGGVVEVEAMVL
jgi:protein SCO1/2